MARKRTGSNRITAIISSAAFPFVLAAVLFFTVCLNTASEIKMTTIIVMVLALGAMIFRFPVLRARITLPLVALGLLVLMDGVSTLYAPAGKFALQEFLKIISAFSLALLLICLAPARGASPERWAATILEGAAAIAALVSIDLLSTHIISSPVLAFLELFTGDFGGIDIVEPGVRMTSLFDNPNVFAGCAGIGVLLSLGLVSSCDSGRERMAHICCLFITSFAFVLAFSMGATASVVAAFIVYLILEKADRRGKLLIIMVETLILAVVGAAIVSMTSFQAWHGFDIVPLGYTAAGCVLLCFADKFINRRFSEKLGAHSKTFSILICIVLAVVIVFALLAFLLTGSAALEGGESLRRAIYPDAGDYTLSTDYIGDVSVTIESQNEQETMMHTSTVLYRGALDEAAFTVPEDSLVVYFNFYTSEGAQLNEVSYESDEASGSVPLGYKLLPGFVANRLQGLLANENAIQRTVFFSDGMKIWQRGPVFGEGLGAFENGIKSVQSFHYETKYAHNHYIQSLVETGVVGLVIFIGLFAASAAAVLISRRKENASALLPALGAALVFMAIHAFTEVVFSVYCYLPFAFGVFALISLACPDAFKWPRSDKRCGSRERLGVTLGFAAVLVAFGVLLVCNISAERLVARSATFSSLERAVRIDRYEWADYALSYVASVGVTDEPSVEMLGKADAYALRLAEVNSNTIPAYLAKYYLGDGREAMGIEMLKKHISSSASDPAAWEQAFEILAENESNTDTFRSGVMEIAQMLEQWNAENIGDITLSSSAQEFIVRISQ